VEGYRPRSFDCKAGSQFHHGHVSGGPPIILDGRISRVQLETLAFPLRIFPGVSVVEALVRNTPRLRWFTRSLVPPRAYGLNTGSESGHHAADGTAKCPEPLCPLPVLPRLGRHELPPGRTLLLRLSSYGLMRRSRRLSSPSAIASCEESTQVATSPCCQRNLLDVILRIFPWLPGPLPRRSHRVHAPVDFPDVIGLPLGRMGWLPASFHERDFSWVSFRDCRHFVMFRPPSLFASQIAPTAMALP
jgi:hypothetical protein